MYARGEREGEREMCFWVIFKNKNKKNTNTLTFLKL